ncbi:hypothetical protein BX600DRAFT_483561 [Xylariales sp. PMI_506]|nr:hypothetical protein BX600DRAFT_483561 [Xylariales sp. PMI_506]
MAADENTPLLSNGDASPAETLSGGKSGSSAWRRWATPEVSLLIACFMITTALCLTQVPILYAIQKMACEDFYDHEPPYTGTGNRCDRREIDAATARQMMYLGMSAIVCGVANLLLTGRQIKSGGPKYALCMNTFFPILRVSAQVIAMLIGSRTGIILMQASQILSVVGGPAGYLMVLNTSIAELVEPTKRTGAFGRLQGVSMFGVAIGYLLGGIIGEAASIERPFEVTGVILAVSYVYCVFCTPYIDPKTMGGSDAKNSSAKKKKAASSPLTALAPQTLRLRDGRIVKSYALPLLALGSFVGGLAVGYAPVLTQMYAATEIGFTPTQNSAYMFMTASIRGVFLMFVFPKIITMGRKWLAPARNVKPDPALENSLPTQPVDFEPVDVAPAEAEPVKTPAPVEEDAGAAFDLSFYRFSMLGDAFITGCIGLTSQPWHIYTAGFFLPLFSGSDASSKGVLTDIIPASQRADAIQAITLVQQVAAVMTVGIFGSLFSAFAEIGQTHLTFFCNAAIAVVAIVVLTFLHLPPQGSTLVEDEDDEESEPIIAEA